MSVAFCRYLLTNNKIEATAFLEAIDVLRSETPALPRLIWDKKLIQAPEMLRVFAHQAEQRISFEASCKALGLWNSQLETELEQILAASHRSIFHVLVDRNLVTPQQLIAAMDEFLAGEAA